MSQQLVSILVSAGGIIVAAAIIGAVRGVFKIAGAIRDNTEAVANLSAQLSEYIHDNNTRAAVLEKDVRDLKDWRLQVESTNRTAAYGGGSSA